MSEFYKIIRKMKNLVITGILILTFMVGTAQTKNLHQFKVTSIDGSELDLASLKGKKVMIVNTASKCGFTPQYKTLQELYENYGGEKFEIIGFPANNFMNQEPGSNSEIEQFCSANYGVTFPMMSKISVKGKDIHPLYQWLTTKAENGKSDNNVSWNFQKFLIDENGNLVESLSPATKPDDKKIVNWLAGK
jgi:glutathione peroxidase